MDPPPPPPPPFSSGTSFPILAIAILGITVTAILLLTYYVFVIKCCLNWRSSDLIRRLSTTRSLLRRYNAEHTTTHSAPAEFHGLEPSAIRAIPIVRFTNSEAKGHECAVCLNEFDEEEGLRLLPNCSHVFHVDCIDIWLQSNANCPICRSEITTPILFPFRYQSSTQHQEHDIGSVVIEVRDDGGESATSSRPNPSPRKRESSKRAKKLHHVSSMGDECIDSRGKDERFLVQPVRRSFSMDSSHDRRLYVEVQEMLQQNPEFLRGVGSGEGSSGGGGRVRRSLFSFGHGHSSRILPIQIGFDSRS